MMRIPFEADQADLVNKMIFETMYHAACEMSYEIALEEGPYTTFNGSPMSQGKFQFDLWGVTPVTT